MNAAQTHRGPDDEGSVVGEAHGLGHRRLSILDHEGGRQPMADSRGEVWITFNGEIYNHRELRDQLAADGSRFRTHSDTEVIIQAFLRWGSGCVERLEGMFAFGIWDDRSGTLLLARDRLGIKPLVWAHVSGSLLFASEAKALLASGLVARTVRTSAIKRYLHNLYVPAPETGFSQIHMLEPGRTLTFSNGRIAMRRYWRIACEPAAARRDGEWIDEFRTHLEQAIRSHVIADVPVGAFLSGGLDSSAVVALMARSSGTDRVCTNTVGFETAGYDERRDARAVAAHVGTDHDEVLLGHAETCDAVQQISGLYDQPFADSSAVATYVLCRAARRRVKVALAGDGADELLAGYPRHRQYAALRRLTRLPRPARAAVAALARLGALTGGTHGRRAINLHHFLTDGGPIGDGIGTYAYLRDPFRNGSYEQQISRGFRSETEDVDPAAHIRAAADDASAADPLQQLLYVELMTYLPNDILQKVDVASMACGLEVRVPFLDAPLVELVAGMPNRLKAGRTATKVVLRRAMADLLPRRTLVKRKQGFHLPLAAWFRNGGRAILEDVLLGTVSLSRGYVDPIGVRAAVDEHVAGIRDHAPRLWALLQLELWHRRWVAAS
jgi:asparagine synthase (glutamine-hydrolysing)